MNEEIKDCSIRKDAIKAELATLRSELQAQMGCDENKRDAEAILHMQARLDRLEQEIISIEEKINNLM